MKSKCFISKKEIDELVEQVSAVVSRSDVRKLKSIGEKYKITLNQGAVVNLNLYWREVVKLLEDLPADNKFRRRLAEEKRWRPGRWEVEEIREFIDYKGIDDEYKLLSDKKWKDLDFLLFRIGTSPEYRVASIGVKAFIDMDGDIREHYSKYSKEQADPRALEFSSKLKKSIDTLFKELSQDEQISAANAVLSYVAEGFKLDADSFHNQIWRGV